MGHQYPSSIMSSSLKPSEHFLIALLHIFKIIKLKPFYLGLALPRPVLSRNRTIFDRLADKVLGDGPQNRYALICRTCGSHNGMARKEEFDFLGINHFYKYSSVAVGVFFKLLKYNFTY